ncbi:glycoside hydrolase N-terminal domain-containing protein [Actinopolymorpha sp. B11F2]|uniref:glycosyl hydrolase family 95 catalytic domain-containing protein n=1 Tax=Actinopolymorpha sp. B11F2 TaxID=3160862 RepID=UPI0032E47934
MAETHMSRRGVLKASAAVAAGSLGVVPLRMPGAEAATPPEDPNPMKLWYQRPAEEWLQALPVGNGRIGAMVFGGVPVERLQLNEDTVWAGGPHDYADPGGLEVIDDIRRLIFEEKWKEAQDLAQARFMGTPTEQQSYQPVGDLSLTFPDPGTPTDYYRELDLTDAVTRVTYVSAGVRRTREMFASHPDQVIVLRLGADQPGAVSFSATFTTPQKSSLVDVDERTIALDGVTGDAEGISGAVRFRALVRALPEGGRVSVANGELTVDGADAVTLLISMGSSYRTYLDVSADEKARAAEPLEAASAKAYGLLRSAHVADYRRLFGRTHIDLGTSDSINLPTDERLELVKNGNDPQFSALYFQFGRYLLISSSRTPGQAANLQGLWNQDMLAPWQSKYTLNINCEMNYWPAGPANLLECYEPLFDMIHEVAESGARTARSMYGTPGWVVHHNTDAWRGTAPVDHAFYGIWPTGGAWLSLSFWDHYLYTGDLAALRRHYPVMRGAVEYFQHNLREDPKHGVLVTTPTHSPEIAHSEIDDDGVSICAGTTMDNQLLRDLFEAFSEASAIVGEDAELAAWARLARSRLAPHQIGSMGQLQEWLEEFPEGDTSNSRHTSHLYGVFPSEQITPRRTPELAQAVRRTLELRGPTNKGWSVAWRMNIWARLLDSAQAYEHLRILLQPGRTAPNLFDLHGYPIFQIDGNFGGVRGIIEMLMQSHSGEIALLPALPAAEWPDGNVRGLRAQDGFEVDVSWRDGSLHQGRVVSLLGRQATVRTSHPVDVVAAGQQVEVERPEPGVAVFETRIGQTYLLIPQV